MTSKKKIKETLSDRIAGLLSTAPENFDPEDDIYEETRAKVNDNETKDSDSEEVGTSRIRRQNVDLLEDVDKRYVGKKGSRKSLKESEDEELSTDEGEALDGIPGTQEFASSDEDEEDIETDDHEEETDNEDEESDYHEEEVENEEYESEENDEDEVELSDENDKNFKHMSETNVSNQIKKGTCVRNQINIWESLLEIRIQLQKCLVSSNKLPQHDIFKDFKTDENFKSETAKAKHNIKNILEKFLTLQELLLRKFPETKTLLQENKDKKKKVDGSDEFNEFDEEIPSDSDAEIKPEDSDEEVPEKRRKISDIEMEIKNRHEKYRNYRNTIIQKWNDKTRLNISKNNKSSTSIIQHINFLLEDKQKLIKRTQLKRSDYEIVGKIKESQDSKPETEHNQTSKQLDEYDSEIFDDDDFYLHLLRELIEYKTAEATDPIHLSRQWIQLQNLRSKMKRKIDTRATKGRKIRYVVHSKLVNFMAPIDSISWTDEARKELFGSLFGNNQLKNTAL